MQCNCQNVRRILILRGEEVRLPHYSKTWKDTRTRIQPCFLNHAPKMRTYRLRCASPPLCQPPDTVTRVTRLTQFCCLTLATCDDGAGLFGRRRAFTLCDEKFQVAGGHRRTPRSAPGYDRPRNRSSGTAGTFVTQPTFSLSVCLTISRQCSGRRGCGAGSPLGCLQAYRPIQGKVADVDVADRDCPHLRADAIAQTAAPNPDAVG